MNILNRVTLKTLAKNKVRTLVTIIGIVLSAAMITAVTTSISSLQNFMLEVVIQTEGSWHGAVFDTDAAAISALKQEKSVERYTALWSLGYAALENPQDDERPYLFVGAAEANAADSLPIHITEGRMPKSGRELILPTHLKTIGGVSHRLGDTLTLALGTRSAGGETLTQHDFYVGGETLDVRETRTYTVVGFYERPSFEGYAAPGYTALTLAEEGDTAAGVCDVYITMKNPNEIYELRDRCFADKGSRINSDLLRLTASSNEDNYNSVLYGMAAILIGIIVFGSISLIYNAFSISVNERTKQFGLLSSVGATKKQLLRSVLFEAGALSLIGVPVGILCGIAGIGVTFHFTENLFASFLNGIGEGAALRLSVSWGAVIAAAVVGAVTVFVSAYLPARRAVRVPAIEAIRQSRDIAIRARQVKTSKLTYWLFGFEGMLASKNFKRNRKKYRATVISLFLSVVLFISASSFCSYLGMSADAVFDTSEYDIAYMARPEDLEKRPIAKLYEELAGVEGVTEAVYFFSENHEATIPTAALAKDYAAYNGAGRGEPAAPETNIIVRLYFIEDEAYSAYLSEQKLNGGDLVRGATAVAFDTMNFYDAQEEKFKTFRMLGTGQTVVSVQALKTIEGYHITETDINEDGETVYLYESGEGDTMRLTAAEAMEKKTLAVGAVAAQKPFCVDGNAQQVLSLLYPFSAYESVLGREAPTEVQFCFQAKNHKDVYEKMSDVLAEAGLSSTRLYDYAEQAESERALVTVINVFSYGFITLISLIAVANVFNTISTNIGLRRREFAMLKSIGLTRKGFHKMMNFECLLYGIKGLIYGIPVAVGVTYLMYRSVVQGWETKFYLPWYSVAISVGSVFLVVFATMLYSMRKINRDNPIDALRNENL